MNNTIETGFASVDFTPAPGLGLFGQMHERIAAYARDPLSANAVAFRQHGLTAVVVAVDTCMMPDEQIAIVQARFQERTGVEGRNLLIHATHTHVAPCNFNLIAGEPDPNYVESLLEAITNAAEQAIARLAPSTLYSGTGYMEQMGWNRRAMFDNGTSRMYGHSEMEGFTELEGPRDPALPVLFARNEQGKIAGIVVNFATHPNSLEGESFYSADIPGASRRALKRMFGEEVGVVYLTGAAGNTAPSLLDPYVEPQPWRGEEGVERSGQYLAGEAAKVIAAATLPMSDPQLRLAYDTLQIPLRTWPTREEASYPEPLHVQERAWANHYYSRAEQAWPELSKTDNPVAVRVSALRIGDSVICSNPAELFVEFGLEMREASPAKNTFIVELADGYCGYIPTALAFSRGGYETWCAPSSKLDPMAGPRIVERTSELMKEVFA